MTTTYGTCTTLDICKRCGGKGEVHSTYREQRGVNSRWYDSAVTCPVCHGAKTVEVTIDLDVDDDAEAAA